MPELVLNFGSYIYFLFLQSDPPWSDDVGAILQKGYEVKVTPVNS
jgi:hypothetical protein